MSKFEKVTKPTIPDVIAGYVNYLEANPAWGSLHVVMDDGNVDDESVVHCCNYALRQGDTLGYALGLILLRMSRTQRGKMADMARRVVEGVR